MIKAELKDAILRALQELEKEKNKSMTRKEQIEQASVEYQMRKKPVAISGAEWADVAYRMNINKDFVKGAEWADENPDERMIAKFLSEKKGYPVDLNDNIPSFEETMKDVENYNKYKEDKLIERAVEWLQENIRDYLYAGTIKDVSLIEDFRRQMEE